MPLDVEFALPARFTIRASGQVTFREIESTLLQYADHPGMKLGADVLVDLCAVAAVPSTPELRVLARGLAPLLQNGMGAVGIVSHKPFAYGVSRVFAVFAEAVGARVAAFREFEDARLWLLDQRGAVSGPRT